MTKIYDIIHLDNQMYMVDKEGPFGSQDKGWVYKKDVTGKIFQHFYTTNTWYNDVRKILASTDESLGLPLLPEVDNNPMILAREAAVMNNYDVENDTFKHGFVVGYKATKAKKYTEEDLLRYMDNRMAIWKKLIKEEVESGRYKQRENPFEWTEKEVHRLAVLSLNLLPKQVEVESTKLDKCMSERCLTHPCNGNCVILKIINNNVQVKRWIYE